MNTFIDTIRIPGAQKLGNDDRSSGGQSRKKSDDQILNLTGRTADSGQRIFTDKTTDNDGINGIIKLLEKSSENNRKKEKKQLFPDNTFNNFISF